MTSFLEDRIWKRQMTRRDFLWLMTVSTAGITTGCATDPITGRPHLMLLSKYDELSMDKEGAPHQFSADYGEVQDPELNRYIHEIGSQLAQNSHRPDMPYSFRAVNANYVNAYAFPAGSIATTHGILLEMENEAELAALLGHEVGHVAARHSAERKSKSILTQTALNLALIALQSSEYSGFTELASMVGGFSSRALLMHYSRENEREADELGMLYMVRNGYNPVGMTGLMEVLVEKSKHKPSILEAMFSTHPMNEERYQTAKESASNEFSSMGNAPLHRDRYMDHTASLRKIKNAIDEMQDGEQHLEHNNFHIAVNHFKQALRTAPDDYAGNVLMAKAQIGLNRNNEAIQYAERAKRIQPHEAQAHHISGISKMAMNRYNSAYQEFVEYEQLLPGNPNTIFLKAVTLESMQQRNAAANEYARYLKLVQEGGQAQHAFSRLNAWGYFR